jgi:hypothetical protein
MQLGIVEVLFRHAGRFERVVENRTGLGEIAGCDVHLGDDAFVQGKPGLPPASPTRRSAAHGCAMASPLRPS